MALQERLKEYLDYKGLTFRDFERFCYLGNGTAANLSEKTKQNTFDRIALGCTDLNLDWLRYGRGEMLKNETSISNYQRGNYNTSNVNSYDNQNTTQSEVFTKALDEIAAQRKMTERMLSLVEDTTRKLLDIFPDKKQ